MIIGLNSRNSASTAGATSAGTTLALVSDNTVLTPTFSGQVANPNNGVVNGLTVTVYADKPTANTVLGTATTDSSGNWTYTHASALTAGITYTFHARVTLTARSVSITQTYATSGSPPVNTVAPSLSGVAAVGQTLTVNLGSWTGSPTPTLSAQWQADGADIAGAVNATYTVTNSDQGKTLRAVVTGSNTAGTASAPSAGVSIPLTSKYQGVSGLVASWEWNKGAQTQTYNGNVLLGYLPDLSGNGYHAIQPQLQFNPLYDAAQGITFGPDMFLPLWNASGLLSGVNGYTVLYNGSINTGAATKAVLGISRVGGSTPHLGLFSIAGTSGNKMRYQGLNATTGSDLSVLSTNGITLGSVDKYCWTVDFANNLVSFYINGVANGAVTTAFTGGTTSPSGTPNNVVLGADSTIGTSGTSSSFQTTALSSPAYMRDLHIFNRVLTPTEVAAL